MVQLGSLLVNACDEQRDAEWPGLSLARPGGMLTMRASSSSTDSPKRRARSHTACVQLSTPICSSYVNACIWLVTRAWSTMVRASAVRPLMAQPMWRSISMIFSMDELSSSGDCTRFSTPRTVPWGVVMPTVVEPS